MPKPRVIGAIVGVLAIAGVAAAIAITNARTTQVQVAAVERGDLALVVSASGDVQTEDKIDVFPPTTGTLASVEVTSGARVKAGQVLAVMDTKPIQAQAAQADAAYAGAIAQRDAAAKSTPGPSDRRAAQAAVDAAYTAFQLADARYQAAKAGAGAPTESDLASAKAAVALAEASLTVAQGAYDSFYNGVYLPAPTPRAPELEAALAALSLARDQASANLITAQKGLAALEAASSNAAAIAAAALARDQAYAAYQAAVAQKEQLAKASSVTGALNSADKAVEAAAAAKALADETLARAEITAPADGIVLFGSSGGASLLGAGSISGATASLGSAGSTSGATLVAGSAVSPGSALFSIVSFEKLAFNALVDETDIVRVQPGMKTTIMLDALPDAPFESEIQSIGWESVTTATGGTAFPVKLVFLPGEQPVLLGMNGSVAIEVKTLTNVVNMPIEALLEEGGTQYVFVVSGGRAHRTKIEAGSFTDTRVEVRSGLSEGDRVIVSGVAQLSDGARVRVK